MKIISIILTLLIGMTNTSAVFAFVVEADWSGTFMLVSVTGSTLQNPDAAGTLDPLGARTPLVGTLQFDTVTGAGSLVIQEEIYSGAPLSFTNVTFQAIGDGIGGPGTLVLMSFTASIYSAANIQQVYSVVDAQGFFDAINTSNFSVISNTGVASCADAAAALAFGGLISPVGPVPFAATTLDVNQDSNANLINNGFPLSDDGVCGVPAAQAPFPGFNYIIDIVSITPTVFPTPAKLVRADWSGVFMYLTPNNGLWTNDAAIGALDPFGVYTPVTGTLVYEVSEGQGWLTVDPFIFSGALASIKDIRISALGDGAGGPGDLLRISFTGGIFGNPDSIGQPAHLVVNAAELLNAVANGTFTTGTVLTGTGATSCTSQNLGPYTGLVTPTGPSPIVMTNQNLVQTGHAALIDGGTPLVDDSICGVPLVTEPFVGFSYSLDFTSITSKGVILLP